MFRRLLAVALAFNPVAGAQEKTFIGAAACRDCHAAEFQRQTNSSHANALYRAAQHPLAARFRSAEPLLRPPDFHFEFLTGAAPRVRADDGRQVTELPLDWAFGAGDHAITFVSKVSGDFYIEHSLSYYPAPSAFALTPRHETLRVNTLHDAMGQAIRTRGPGPAITDCFRCHSTGPVSVSSNGEVQVTETGVRCESCHGPGSAHRSAALAGNTALAKHSIQKSGELSLCGACHRPINVALDWNSPWSVRHQPPYLARSQCFKSGKLSCLSCHDPHEQVRRNDAAYYRARCTGCHNGGHHPAAKICRAPEKTDCTMCHMPLVAFGANMKFRNHWIGIYDERNPLTARATSRLR